MQIFGARKFVESRVVGWQNDSVYGLIFRCIQTCDGEFADLPEADVLAAKEKWQDEKDLKALKNAITTAVENDLPTSTNLDNPDALVNWILKEVAPKVDTKKDTTTLIKNNTEVAKCIELCKKQARVNLRMKREAEEVEEERAGKMKRSGSFLGCL